MEQTALTIFVGMAAIAMILQAMYLARIYKASRGVHDNMQRLMPRIESLIDTSQRTIEETRKEMEDLAMKTGEILDTTRVQLERVDDLLADAASRVRVQMDRAELVIDDAMRRTQQTVALVHGGIIKPIHQVQAVAAGLKTALAFLTRGRPNPTRATSDEEMFI